MKLYSVSDNGCRTFAASQCQGSLSLFHHFFAKQMLWLETTCPNKSSGLERCFVTLRLSIPQCAIAHEDQNYLAFCHRAGIDATMVIRRLEQK
jgi:hypothetical protein